MANKHDGENWPYHESKNGKMVACESNPCKLHGGSDVMASSPEEAYKVKYDSKVPDSQNGLGNASSEKQRVLDSMPKEMDKELWDDSPVNFNDGWSDALSHGDDVAKSSYMGNAIKSCNSNIVSINKIQSDLAKDYPDEETYTDGEWLRQQMDSDGEFLTSLSDSIYRDTTGDESREFIKTYNKQYPESKMYEFVSGEVEDSGDDDDIMSSVNSASSAGVGNGTIYDNDEFADKLREGADVDSLSDDEARYLASLQATRELFRYSKNPSELLSI